MILNSSLHTSLGSETNISTSRSHAFLATALLLSAGLHALVLFTWTAPSMDRSPASAPSSVALQLSSVNSQESPVDNDSHLMSPETEPVTQTPEEPDVAPPQTSSEPVKTPADAMPEPLITSHQSSPIVEPVQVPPPEPEPDTAASTQPLPAEPEPAATQEPPTTSSSTESSTAPAKHSEADIIQPDQSGQLAGFSENELNALEDDYLSEILQRLQQAFDYPTAALRRRQQGEVILELNIARDGYITSARLAEGSGHRLLDEAALSMVNAISPLPPLPERFQDGNLVLGVPVQFRLQ